MALIFKNEKERCQHSGDKGNSQTNQDDFYVIRYKKTSISFLIHSIMRLDKQKHQR